ncbi:TraB/VirB10 family protein [Thiocapsa marina]|uniref:Conjugation TrbI family protein n=1 Tax=Thiocapsa marina 5811 TaxID=768671 RepID=F9UHY1_9GAMM|nr:TraB/VirB10 family protein [Thiocapsa marina]EGV16157.1 hypothetical protein ThimaDRAFT_4534 [Thiocapsa marina 5811]
MITRRLSILVAVLAASSAQADPTFEIPPVPCTLLDAGCTPSAVSSVLRPSRSEASPEGLIRTVMGGGATPAPRTGGNLPVTLELGPRNLTVTPGTTVLVEIAIGHLNRIVTPFADPVVSTVSNASTQVDGSVIEIPIDGYAVGEDGKVGVRGRVVSKQGVLLAKALQAGFLQSFSQIFNRMPTIPVNTGTGTDLQFQSMLTPQALSAASAQGVGGAMDRLANYYLDMAEQLLPVIEVDAGRGAEFILNRGVSMKLADVVE